MSILYKALSKAARENAEQADGAPLVLGNDLGDDPGTAFDDATYREPRRRPWALLGVAGLVVVACIGGYVYLTSLEDDDVVVNTGGEIVDFSKQNQAAAGADEPDVIAADPSNETSDDALVETVEVVEVVETADTVEPVELAEPDVTTETQTSTALDIVPAASLDVVNGSGTATDVAEISETAETTTSENAGDVTAAVNGETIEETLARLSNERGGDDLTTPIDVDRTPEAAMEAATTGDGAITVSSVETAATETTPETTVEFTIDAEGSGNRQKFEAAYAALQAGNAEAAMDLYMDVLREEPDNQFALFGLASTLQRMGWLGEARATYEELLAIDPNNRGALTNMMALIAQEAPDQALANLQRLYEINPGFSPIPAQIGLLYADMGDYGEAVRNLSLAIDMEPDNMNYVYNLAIIHDRLGQHTEAQALYEQVIEFAQYRDVSVPVAAIRERVSYLKRL
ncbi:MAG: tetratricopeptide repeat protein [Pseudomonadota bacterium]